MAHTLHPGTYSSVSGIERLFFMLCCVMLLPRLLGSLLWFSSSSEWNSVESNTQGSETDATAGSEKGAEDRGGGKEGGKGGRPSHHAAGGGGHMRHRSEASSNTIHVQFEGEQVGRGIDVGCKLASHVHPREGGCACVFSLVSVPTDCCGWLAVLAVLRAVPYDRLGFFLFLLFPCRVVSCRVLSRFLPYR